MATLEIFLERHGAEQFRHHDDLITQIKAGQCVLNDSPRANGSGALARNLLSIYGLRATVWQSLFGIKAQTSIEDMQALCEELKKEPDDLVSFWAFRVKTSPVSEYVLFESLSSCRILGCIFFDGEAKSDFDE